MKIAKASQLNLRNVLTDKKALERYMRDLDSDLQNIMNVLQGRVSFGVGGDGNRGQNVEGEFQQFTSSVTPDAENTIAHGLGSIPVGHIVLWQDKAGSLYQGPTTGTNWTASNIYLKCDVASVEFLIFLVKKGQST